jgi:hypothetical protein
VHGFAFAFIGLEPIGIKPVFAVLFVLFFNRIPTEELVLARSK